MFRNKMTEKAIGSTDGSGKRYTSEKNKTSRWIEVKGVLSTFTHLWLLTVHYSDAWRTVIPKKAAAVAETSASFQLKIVVMNLHNLLNCRFNLWVFLKAAYCLVIISVIAWIVFFATEFCLVEVHVDGLCFHAVWYCCVLWYIDVYDTSRRLAMQLLMKWNSMCRPMTVFSPSVCTSACFVFSKRYFIFLDFHCINEGQILDECLYMGIVLWGWTVNA